MKYILVYHKESASVFEVDILTLKNPIRANRKKVATGSYKEMIDIIKRMVSEKNSVRTAHCDIDGEIDSLPWKRGVGQSYKSRIIINEGTEKRKRVDYKKYLKSYEWGKIRRKILKRDKHRCKICNSGKNLNIHHRTYKRLGHELPEDLVTLCRNCHEIFHIYGGLKK